MRLIGVDVGGTFTDAVFADTQTDRLAIHKVPTSSDDPSLGVMRAITELCRYQTIPLDGIALIYHGTTIATNALLEYKGATAGMITTQGYRDILHIGRHQRAPSLLHSAGDSLARPPPGPPPPSQGCFGAAHSAAWRGPDSAR